MMVRATVSGEGRDPRLRAARWDALAGALRLGLTQHVGGLPFAISSQNRAA